MNTSKKGISPLVATVLLLAFVVAVSMIVSTWLRGYSGDITDRASEQKDITYECLKVRPVIDSVTINRTNEYIKVNVRNAGSSQIKFVQGWSYDTEGRECHLKFNLTELPYGELTFAWNDSCEIYETNCDDFTEVRLTTTCADSTAKFTGTPTCHN